MLKTLSQRLFLYRHAALLGLVTSCSGDVAPPSEVVTSPSASNQGPGVPSPSGAGGMPDGQTNVPGSGGAGPIASAGAGGGPNPGVSPSPTNGPDPVGPPGVGPDEPNGPGNPDDNPCVGEEVLASKRLIRLTFNQLGNAVASLLGEQLADDIRTRFELPSALERTFPPLNNPREGAVIIDAQWQTGDEIAQAAGQFVLDNFSTVTSCGDAPTVDCARGFADDFVERAFRRPLDPDEHAAFLGVFDGILENEGSVQQATQYAIYAALSAPQFLYRTEFGADSSSAGTLTPYETASLLSFFITDGPPDQELLDAAAANALTTPEQLAAHADRLLQLPGARENLQTAMYSYFGISTLNTIVIDPLVAPRFNEGLRASMMHETELFINDVLWNGTVQDLLLSRSSYVNAGLADIYGIEFPPAGASLDEDGFAKVTLPDDRSGLLTQPGYLTTRSSPDEPSVVRRGLLVNASLLCVENPPFPEEQADAIDEIVANLGDVSEREAAEFRASRADCGACHRIFDAYGLALDRLDVIGAYREMDPEGRPIDATITLPSNAGGATVSTPAEMARELVESGAFTTCVAKNFIAYALAEASTISANSCATRRVADALPSSDQTFSSLIREITRSSTFSQRSSGASE